MIWFPWHFQVVIFFSVIKIIAENTLENAIEIYVLAQIGSNNKQKVYDCFAVDR